MTRSFLRPPWHESRAQRVQGGGQAARDAEHRQDAKWGYPLSFLHALPAAWKRRAAAAPGVGGQHRALDISLVSHRGAAHTMGTARRTRAAVVRPCCLTRAGCGRPLCAQEGCFGGGAGKSALAATKALTRAPFGAGCEGKAPLRLTHPGASGDTPQTPHLPADASPHPAALYSSPLPGGLAQDGVKDTLIFRTKIYPSSQGPGLHRRPHPLR